MERLKEILIILFTLICDFIVLFSLVYFGIQGFAWYWFIVLIAITSPVLFLFNRGSIEIIKSWFKKKE